MLAALNVLAEDGLRPWVISEHSVDSQSLLLLVTLIVVCRGCNKIQGGSSCTSAAQFLSNSGMASKAKNFIWLNKEVAAACDEFLFLPAMSECACRGCDEVPD